MQLLKVESTTMGDFLERSGSRNIAVNHDTIYEANDLANVRENTQEWNSYKSQEKIEIEDVTSLYSTSIEADCSNEYTNEQIESKGQVSFDNDSAADGHRKTSQTNFIHEENTKSDVMDITAIDEPKDNEEIVWLKCKFCEYKTKHRQILVRHFIVKHDETAEWLQCQFCEYRSKVKSDLKNHMNYTHNDNIELFACQFCEFKTKRKCRLRDHINCKHNANPKLLNCDLCDYKTKWRSSLNKHVKYKHDNNLEWHYCKLCEYKTKCKEFLINHHKNRHDENVEQYCCEICVYKTKSKSQLLRHMKINHYKEGKYLYSLVNSKQNEKTVANDLCKESENMTDGTLIRVDSDNESNKQATFRPGEVGQSISHGRENLTDVMIHEENFKSGDICEEIDTAKLSAQGNNSSESSDVSDEDYSDDTETVQWYQCSFCEYRTKDKDNLICHLKEKHNNNIEWLKCYYCDYNTKDKHALISHFKSTHNQKAKWLQYERFTLERHVSYKNHRWHNCELCEYKTKDRYCLVKHHKTKHEKNVEWHNCELCDYKTKFKPSLKHHFLLKHDVNAEWYQCRICGYKTKIESRLSCHMKSSHAKGVKYTYTIVNSKTNTVVNLEQNKDSVDSKICQSATPKDEFIAPIKVDSI